MRQGVRLVAERGRLMEEALPAPHGMDVGPECMAALRAAEVGTNELPFELFVYCGCNPDPF